MVSLYTGTVRVGPVETNYDVRADTPIEARTMIAHLAKVNPIAIKGFCRVLGCYHDGEVGDET